jgi:hypothetical protein
LVELGSQGIPKNIQVRTIKITGIYDLRRESQVIQKRDLMLRLKQDLDAKLAGKPGRQIPLKLIGSRPTCQHGLFLIQQRDKSIQRHTMLPIAFAISNPEYGINGSDV